VPDAQHELGLTRPTDTDLSWQEVPDAQHGLSDRELTDDHLPDTIVAVLARNSHRARHLGIEIVEEYLADPVILTGLRHLH